MFTTSVDNQENFNNQDIKDFIKLNSTGVDSVPVLTPKMKRLEEILSQELGENFKTQSLMDNLREFQDNYTFPMLRNSSPEKIQAKNLAVLFIIEQINASSVEALNAQDADQQTLLHIAVNTFILPIVTALCEKELNLEIKNKYGRTPLEHHLNLLANCFMSEQSMMEVCRYLLKIGACEESLSDKGKESLKNLREKNWKTFPQREAETKHKEVLQKKDHIEYNMREVYTDLEEFTRNNFSCELKFSSSPSSEEIIVKHTILDKEIGFESESEFYQALLLALKKLSASSDIVKQVFSIYAALLKQQEEKSSNEDPYVIHLLLTKKFIALDHKESSGQYLPDTNVIQCVLNENVVKELNQFIATKEINMVKFLAILLHEMFHLIIDKYLDNHSKLCPQPHIDENWKIKEKIKETLLNEVTDNKIRAKRSLSNQQREIYFLTTAQFKEGDPDKYSLSKVTAELPALFVGISPFFDLELLKQSLPYTYQIVTSTLQEMYEQYCEPHTEEKKESGNINIKKAAFFQPAPDEIAIDKNIIAFFSKHFTEIKLKLDTNKNLLLDLSVSDINQLQEMLPKINIQKVGIEIENGVHTVLINSEQLSQAINQYSSNSLNNFKSGFN